MFVLLPNLSNMAVFNLSPAASELNFHIWNANPQSCARAKSETKMVAHGGQFWTSVSVFYADLYVSSSPLHDLSY